MTNAFSKVNQIKQNSLVGNSKVNQNRASMKNDGIVDISTDGKVITINPHHNDDVALSKVQQQDCITISNAKVHNLKNVSLKIKRNELTVITGPSGSGKSSLAFDTIYAEGQRRYMESLSSYARQFLGMMTKPDVEFITGLSPTIAIDQKTTSRNPRSTVATITEIYDYIRLLFARVGIAYSPATNLPIEAWSASQIIKEIQSLPAGAKFNICSPVIRGQKGEYKKLLINLRRQGFQRAKLDGKSIDLDDIADLDKNKKHTLDIIVDRLEMSESVRNRVASSIETALQLSEGLVYAEMVSLPEGVENVILNKQPVKAGSIVNFSEKFCCPVSGFTIPEIEPRIFSFNSPYGACDACNGLGYERHFLQELIFDDTATIREGGVKPFATIANSKFYMQIFEGLARHYDFSLDVDCGKLDQKVKDIILNGTGEEKIVIDYNDGVRKIKVKKSFEGVLRILQQKMDEFDGSSAEESFEQFQGSKKCSCCGGYRLSKSSLSIKIADKHIGQVCEMTVEDSYSWFDNLYKQLNENQNKIASVIVKEVKKRLVFLRNVGLEYLNLSRESSTLSGGESQRIRLASQIGSELTGVIYVLDEPSIGLHQSDNEKLITTLKYLRNLGNTVIVVEHDEETMMAADTIVDVGPGAGVHGGNIVAIGTPQEVMDDKNSITGGYLSGRLKVWDAVTRRSVGKKMIEIVGANLNNLKDVDVKIPLDVFTVVTGVSGCGKSSLIIHTLYDAILKRLHKSKQKSSHFTSINGLDHIEKVIEIDQSPIGRTPRSNPATYTGCFNHIRDLFANLPEARRRGYKPSRFSFNVKGGRCEACQGDGMVKVEMHFLPDVYVACEVCEGKRYNKETLEIVYKGHSISSVLDMPIENALELFASIPVIAEKLQCLVDVGLGYMKLGQSATTLSGGESQRIKLSKELSKKSLGNQIYILDEPTTGLHSSDIKKLLSVLHRLVDQGNSMIVIEHNMDVIKTADWIIDMGPKGGINGGKVVACGVPEDIARVEESLTGRFLKKYLD